MSDATSEGSLTERDFPDLVQSLYERRWTGTLTVSHAGIGKTVTVQDGRLVFASSSSPDERLGELLLRLGRLRLRQMAEASVKVGAGKRLGTVLVESGFLSPKDLVKSVVEHSQEIIYGAFQWTEGRYRLQEGLESAESITLRMSTPDIIMEGIRRIESWSRVSRAVGGLSARYACTETWQDVVKGMSLSVEQLALLTGLREPTDLGTMCDGARMPDFEVCRTLWALRIIGAIRRLDAPVAKVVAADDEGLDFVVGGE